MVSFDFKGEIRFTLQMDFPPPHSQHLSHWQPYTEEENKFFQNLFVTKDEVIEKETTKQPACNKRKSLQNDRITPSDTHFH